MKQPVIAIFDIGKTNKKLFLFNENYKIVFERLIQLPEIVDEDGEVCEDVESLRTFVLESFSEVTHLKNFAIKAINFSGYGASFVYLNNDLRAFLPLYNYLKKYTESLRNKFYDTYGGEGDFSFSTASPVLGSLNSGMQLYRIKYEKPEIYKEIKWALHLPQYLSFLLTHKVYSDITSIGCHTNLWDFTKNEYHHWVKQEGIEEKLAPIVSCTNVFSTSFENNTYLVGIGLHDSSAALIPYLINFKEPFILISTGTWCISLNPFNNLPLTKEELENDCLCYMNYKAEPVKASRLFAGNEHEEQVIRISAHFDQTPDKFRTMDFNPDTIDRLQKINEPFELAVQNKNLLKRSLFADRDMSYFVNEDEAYHQLMLDIITQQYISTNMVLKGTDVKRIFVDGGFSKNVIYMNLLASVFPELEIFAASIAHGTAVGAALCIHESWTKKPLPNDIIELKYFSYGYG